jgi:hypothetical protein
MMIILSILLEFYFYNYNHIIQNFHVVWKNWHDAMQQEIKFHDLISCSILIIDVNCIYLKVWSIWLYDTNLMIFKKILAWK